MAGKTYIRGSATGLRWFYGDIRKNIDVKASFAQAVQCCCHCRQRSNDRVCHQEDALGTQARHIESDFRSHIGTIAHARRRHLVRQVKRLQSAVALFVRESCAAQRVSSRGRMGFVSRIGTEAGEGYREKKEQEKGKKKRRG